MALGKNLKKRSQLSDQEATLGTDLIPEERVILEGTISEEEVKVDDDGTQPQLMCVFKSGGEEYGIPIDDVKEVVKLGSIAPVPQMPNYILGMVNVRGTIYGVLDLALFFGVSEVSDQQFNFLVVINDEERKIAIRTPTVPDTLQVSNDLIENLSSSMLKSINKQEYLGGIIKKDKRMIIVLNILEMISSDSFVQ